MRRLRVIGLGLCLLAMAIPAQASPDRTPRIVGGTEVAPDEFPFLVALVHASSSSVYDGQFCGGTLIDPEWVLTAGHCVDGETAASIDVYANDYDLTGSGDRIDVDAVYQHPFFDGDSLENDAALLHLAAPAKDPAVANDTVRLAIGSDRDLFAPGEPVITAGWGATHEPPGTASYPERARKVSVPVQSNAACAAVYPGFVPPDMICAGYEVGGADACYGDSGGPLFVAYGDGTYVQLGIVSWGKGCAKPDYFGVYTLVVPYVCWIAETMANGTLGYGRTTTEGSPGPDVFGGSGGDDVYLGWGGDDTIDGGDGADVLCGGDGHDTIGGGHGSDVIDGGAGADDLRGGSGMDFILGGLGDDTIFGNEGPDGLLGGPGDDDIAGNRGRDAINGEGDSDTLRGGKGGDAIRGGFGVDFAFGNRGPDQIRGDEEDDHLKGGADDDDLRGGKGFDDLDGGSGSDTCDGEVVSRCEG